MGNLIRKKDWASTAIGPPGLWPQSLQTTLGILLNSAFPMFIWWGKELIQFYNDAYRPSLGKDGKHPGCLGQKGEECWPEIWPIVKPLIDQVLNGGPAIWREDQLIPIYRNGKLEDVYWTFSYSPIQDDEGAIGGVLVVCHETTEKVLAQQRLRESERNLRSTILQAPVAMCILKEPDYILEIANERMYELWGRGADDLLHKPIFEALPEAANKGLEELLLHVYTTGETYSGIEQPITVPRNGKPQTLFVNFVYEAFRDGNGEVTGIIAVAVDVTTQVMARKKIEESEWELQQKVEERTADVQRQKVFISSILDASFNGIYALKAIRNAEGRITDFSYLFANNNIAKLLHLKADEVIGASMLALIPENKDNGFFEHFCTALHTGETKHDITHFVTNKINNWYDFLIVPIDKETIVVTIQDITEQKQATLQIEQQKNLLDNILKYSSSGISVSQVIRDKQGKLVDAHTVLANDAAVKLIGIPKEVYLSKTALELDSKIMSSSYYNLVLNTLQTGEPFHTQYFLESTGRWLETSVSKMDDDHIITIFTDVTILKNAQLEIELSEGRLAAVFNHAQSGMFTFAPIKDDHGDIIDFRFVITNPKFASYVGQTPEVLNGALGSTWFPGYLHNGVFDMYKKTCLTGQTQRIDIHYNVDGHDIYLDLMSARMGEEVLVTFNDYTPLKKAQLQLEQYVDELKRSNKNLEEFAYAASHDLKEPIRKIRFFSDSLKNTLATSLNEEQKRLFERMEAAAKRMSSLIDDLLSYSQITLRPHTFEEVDMNELMNLVLSDLDLDIEEKKAKIKVDKFFTIKGHQQQLQQAFQNLIGNTLKYNKPGVEPVIEIKCSQVVGKDSGFHLSYDELQRPFYIIEVSDNGIGFEQQEAERIFNVFTRLHGNKDYKGTGVGLSIVRKVIENHNGHIQAEGKAGQGATFKVLLPAE